MNLDEARVLVTGASSGIGAALARELAGRGATVGCVARRRQRLEEVVDELQRARYGPTAVLMEISQILSVDGGPTIDPEELEERRRRDPLARYNVGWDVHRLWLSEFVEESRDCLIRGVGKTNEDVAEFIRRLILSERFERVELVKTESAQDTDTGLPTTRFELTCGVIY